MKNSMVVGSVEPVAGPMAEVQSPGRPSLQSVVQDPAKQYGSNAFRRETAVSKTKRLQVVQVGNPFSGET